MRFCFYWPACLVGSVLLRVSAADGEVAALDDDQLVAKRVEDLLEMREAGLDFFGNTAKKAGKHAGANCLLGGIFGFLTGGMQGGALGCKVAAGVMAVATVVDEVAGHWSEQMRRAMKAWGLYTWSYKTLGIAPWEMEKAEHEYRKCMLKNHPDKLPRDAKERQIESAAVKFANCRFAIHYIRVFRAKYGKLDFSSSPENLDRTRFLKAFAGVWASSFSKEDQMRDSEIQNLADVVAKNPRLVEL